MGNTSGEVMQFLKESAGDPLFCQIQCDGCHSGEGKATASSILVFDEEGELTGVKGPAEIGQDIAGHQAMIEALNNIDPQKQAELENQQLMSIAAQQKNCRRPKKKRLNRTGSSGGRQCRGSGAVSVYGSAL